MKKVYIEEIDGEFFVYKVDCIMRGNDLDHLAEKMTEDGYEVRVGGCLSKFD